MTPAQVLEVCLTLFHITALSLTIFRLYHRVYTHRWWWDDAAACLALIADCVYVASLWAPTNNIHTQAAQTQSFWLAILPFLFIIGSVRISLALSLARIFPSWQITHRISVYMAIGFAFVYSSLLIVMGIRCGIPHAIVWYPALGTVICYPAQQVTFIVIGADITSDLFLIAIPLTTLWHLKLPSNQRRLVLAGFSSGIWTTIASVTATVILLRLPRAGNVLRIVLPHIEAIVSLLSCNFLITITMIYRVFWKVEDLEGSSSNAADTSGLARRHSSDVTPTTIVLDDLSDLALEDSSFHEATGSTEPFERSPIIPIDEPHGSNSKVDNTDGYSTPVARLTWED